MASKLTWMHDWLISPSLSRYLHVQLDENRNSSLETLELTKLLLKEQMLDTIFEQALLQVDPEALVDVAIGDEDVLENLLDLSSSGSIAEVGDLGSIDEEDEAVPQDLFDLSSSESIAEAGDVGSIGEDEAVLENQFDLSSIESVDQATGDGSLGDTDEDVPEQLFHLFSTEPIAAAGDVGSIGEEDEAVLEDLFDLSSSRSIDEAESVGSLDDTDEDLLEDVLDRSSSEPIDEMGNGSLEEDALVGVLDRSSSEPIVEAMGDGSLEEAEEDALEDVLDPFSSEPIVEAMGDGSLEEAEEDAREDVLDRSSSEPIEEAVGDWSLGETKEDALEGVQDRSSSEPVVEAEGSGSVDDEDELEDLPDLYSMESITEAMGVGSLEDADEDAVDLDYTDEGFDRVPWPEEDDAPLRAVEQNHALIETKEDIASMEEEIVDLDFEVDLEPVSTTNYSEVLPEDEEEFEFNAANEDSYESAPAIDDAAEELLETPHWDAATAAVDEEEEPELPLGYYIYSVALNHHKLELPEAGIDPEHPVFAFCFDQLQVIASEVPVEIFGEEAFRSRLDDSEWLQSTLRSQDEILARIQPQSTMIPMRVCTVYDSIEGLNLFLEEHYDDLVSRLELIERSETWVLSIVCNRRKLRHLTARASNRIREIHGELAGKTGAQADQLMEKIDAVLEEETRAVCKACVKHSHGVLASISSKAQVQEPAGAEGNLAEIFRSDYLVEKGRVEAFITEAEGLVAAYKPLAFELRVEGPAAPTRFITPEDPLNSRREAPKQRTTSQVESDATVA